MTCICVCVCVCCPSFLATHTDPLWSVRSADTHAVESETVGIVQQDATQNNDGGGMMYAYVGCMICRMYDVWVYDVWCMVYDVWCMM